MPHVHQCSNCNTLWHCFNDAATCQIGDFEFCLSCFKEIRMERELRA